MSREYSPNLRKHLGWYRRKTAKETVSAVILIGMGAAIWALSEARHGGSTFMPIAFCVVFCGMLLARYLLLVYRINEGHFGNNAAEVGEIIVSITERKSQEEKEKG